MRLSGVLNSLLSKVCSLFFLTCPKLQKFIPLKTKSLKNKIDLAFLSVAIILILLIYSTYSGTKSLKENRRIVYHTSTMNTILQKVVTSAVDIETGTRGYALTGKENYLEVYIDGNKKINLWLDSLRIMSNKDRYQLERLDTIENLIKSQRIATESSIRFRKSLGIEKMEEHAEIARGKEVMDSIRQVVADLQQTQINLLSSKLAESNQNVKQRDFVFLIFVILTVLLIAASYIIIRKSAAKSIDKEVIQSELINELSIQNNQMNDFASITSHNLRSPAANITSLISIIDENSIIDDYKMIFEMLKKVSINLNETLNSLLEILHIKKNKTIEKEVLRFDEIFLKTTESLQGEILISEALIESDFSKAEEILYPRIYLESIFHNLIGNALKYRSPDRKPHVIVKTFTKDSFVHLIIQDNGLGIDLTKHANKIFGMHQVFHRHPDAKGIGLFITKAQIESLQGKITVKSEVNSGSIFTVSFNRNNYGNNY